MYKNTKQRPTQSNKATAAARECPHKAARTEQRPLRTGVFVSATWRSFPWLTCVSKRRRWPFGFYANAKEHGVALDERETEHRSGLYDARRPTRVVLRGNEVSFARGWSIWAI